MTNPVIHPGTTIYTTGDVAREMGCKPATVWTWIQMGRLPALRIGRQYFVTPNDLADFKAARQEAGR